MNSNDQEHRVSGGSGRRVVTSILPEIELDVEDLDYPTFLRKKAD